MVLFSSKKERDYLKPILFNTEMVRAILDGRKTTTRRAVKNLAISDNGDGYFIAKEIHKGEITEYLDETFGGSYDFVVGNAIQYAPYQKGDILYVRETWQRNNFDLEKEEMTVVYKADNSYANIKLPSDKFKKQYNAMSEAEPDWHPSLHMPKEAARIFLKVTDIRAERLKDIAPVDAISEGIEYTANGPLHWHFNDCISKTPISRNFETYTEAFSALWNSTVKKADLDKYGWDTNLWVWIISFERCEKPGDNK